jgi:DNA-binding transcriptional MerR regulator/effector-binding domain-containing protein
MKPMFQIGHFARLAGISAKQLRAYDEIGLFRPVWVDPSSAYRYYSPAQLPELRRILALRQLGMPIDEIGALARGGDLRDALARRRAELEEERRRVEERLSALEISVADDAAVDVVVRPVGVEPVAIMPASDAVGEDFYALETYVRDLGRRAHRPPGAFPATREIWVPVTGPVPDTDRIAYRRLPACRVASVIHRGPYGGVAAARRRLLRWVEAAGLASTGPMRTLYLQFGAEPELRVPEGWVVDSDEQFVTELQVPIGD